MSKPNTKVKQILRNVSQRIRYLRRKQGLSMSALAQKAGFTKSYLSQIENMKREPTIGTMVSIAHALGVDVFSILNDEGPIRENESLAIVKAKDRRVVSIPDIPSTNILESINYLKKDRTLDGYILTSGFEFPEEPIAHEGQELLFILEGKQELLYNGQSYILEEGDCCCFDATTPHYGRSLGKKASKALIVYSIPPKD